MAAIAVILLLLCCLGGLGGLLEAPAPTPASTWTIPDDAAETMTATPEPSQDPH